MIDLAVAYRIYPGVSKSPAFYQQDKFLLSRMCLRSFAASLGKLKVKVWAILDGCPEEYDALFRETLFDCDLEIVHTNSIGNLATFDKQVDILTSQELAEYVYFAEDDYFYLPHALEKMVTFMRNNRDVDFVTPYDHPDSYVQPSRIERHHVRPGRDGYWRTASSTCLTFLTSRTCLRRTERALRTYSCGNGDYPMWQALTQRLSLLDPRIHFAGSFRIKSWLRIWRWGFSNILFRTPCRLWAPIPTLATHMESTGLAPGVDWLETFRNFEQQWSDSALQAAPQDALKG